MTLIISAATWDKELKSGMRQEALIPLAREAGCAGVEFRPYWQNIEEEIPQIRKALLENNLVCAYASNEALLAGSQQETLQAIDSLKAGVLLADRLGAKVLRFNVASGAFDVSFVHTSWWADAMKQVLEAAKSLGIVLAVENGPDAQKGNPQVFKEIFAVLPELELTYDTGNWLYANTKPEAALDWFLPRVGYVHLKDIICENAALKHGHPGTGIVDVKGLKERIEASGYTGIFALEFPGGDKPMERVFKSLAYLG
ncbi:sugar phosphate isomerase/epimerase family protein [Sporomusa sp.]|uniref:sugar phosphate isomerase/epimerase family protein n=1 Tax=Sporomusa sp. TaxID=2078658 RepID=UPI002B8C68ED|nr:sugar phosphate isomerase/epimerase family protein [Sporomusa sp.]HWR07163.1 sugar phosphate isomerase/epimerase family protein [Sporomusa sp.]